jgi:hypothetical protein
MPAADQSSRARRTTGKRRRRRRRWSREELVEQLRTNPALQRGLPPSLQAACRQLFGGVTAARAAAGRPFVRAVWSKERVIAALRERAARGEYGIDKPLMSACTTLFGTVKAARMAAGTPSSRPRVWSKERVIGALREHAARGEYALDPKFKAACHHLFGSIKAARMAAGTPSSPPRAWSAERVVRELRQRAAAGELRIDEPLANACTRYFGSVPQARSAAGIGAPARPVWTRATVIARVRDAVAQDRIIEGALRNHAIDLFGSVAAARDAAKGPQIPPPWSRDAVLAELRAVGAARVCWTLAAGCRKHFGSVRAARLAAGVPVPPKPRRWTRDRVLSELRRIGSAPVESTLGYACRIYFGSVRFARLVAGVGVAHRRRCTWTRTRLLHELRTNPTYRRDLPYPVRYACIKLFGGVRAARIAAGTPVRESWSRARVIAELRARHARGLQSLGGKLSNACIIHFGGVDAARKAANVPTKQRWTPERVIAALRELDARGERSLPPTLKQASKRVFGSVPAARHAALGTGS